MSTQYAGVKQDELDEMFAQNPNDNEMRQEYINRGLDPDTGESTI
jgi:hypothetical protein